jgi:hypothetical protein
LGIRGRLQPRGSIEQLETANNPVKEHINYRIGDVNQPGKTKDNSGVSSKISK